MKKKRYPRDESLYNLIQENEWFFFFRTLPELIHSVSGNSDLWLKKGRPPKKLSHMLTCLAIWQRFPNLSVRSAKGFLEFLKFYGIIDVDIPCFKTLCNYQANERIKYYLDMLIETSSKPLNAIETCFSTDMTGIRTNNFSSWFSIRTGKRVRKRDHLSSHITTGVISNIVTAVDSCVKKGMDNEIMREHVDRTTKNFKIDEWSGDSMYWAKENCNKVVEAGGKPYFKPKKSWSGKSRGCMAWKNMNLEFKENSEEAGKHYHKRSNSESTNHSKKTRIGSCVKSKLNTAKEQEDHIKWVDYNLLVLNRALYEWDIEPNFYT